MLLGNRLSNRPRASVLAGPRRLAVAVVAVLAVLVLVVLLLVHVVDWAVGLAATEQPELPAQDDDGRPPPWPPRKQTDHKGSEEAIAADFDAWVATVRSTGIAKGGSRHVLTVDPSTPLCLLASDRDSLHTAAELEVESVPLGLQASLGVRYDPQPRSVTLPGVVLLVPVRAPEHVFHAIVDSSFGAWNTLVQDKLPANTARVSLVPLLLDHRDRALTPSVVRILELTARAVQLVRGVQTQLVVPDGVMDLCFTSVVTQIRARQGLEPVKTMDLGDGRIRDAQRFRASMLQGHGVLWPQRRPADPVRILLLQRRDDAQRAISPRLALEAGLAAIPHARLRVVLPLPELVSWDEQVRLVSEADILVSGHGAELVHMWSLRPGSHVVEILPFGFDHVRFANLAKLLRLAHRSFMVPALSDRVMDKGAAAPNFCGATVAPETFTDAAVASAFFREHYECREVRWFFRAQALDIEPILGDILAHVREAVGAVLQQRSRVR